MGSSNPGEKPASASSSSTAQHTAGDSTKNENHDSKLVDEHTALYHNSQAKVRQKGGNQGVDGEAAGKEEGKQHILQQLPPRFFDMDVVQQRCERLHSLVRQGPDRQPRYGNKEYFLTAVLMVRTFKSDLAKITWRQVWCLPLSRQPCCGDKHSRSALCR